MNIPDLLRQYNETSHALMLAFHRVDSRLSFNDMTDKFWALSHNGNRVVYAQTEEGLKWTIAYEKGDDGDPILNSPDPDDWDYIVITDDHKMKQSGDYVLFTVDYQNGCGLVNAVFDVRKKRDDE